MTIKRAYLTIDDAPTADFMPKLDYLTEHELPAVLFCIGNSMQARPDMMVEAIKRGYIIGNHSLTHPRFSHISIEQANDELQRTHDLIESLYQQADVTRPARFFRFPYGDKGNLEGATNKDAIQSFLRDLGYTQPAFEGVTYAHYRAEGMLDDVDWYWTYDCLEWSTFQPEPMYGIDSLDAVYARMEEDVPDGGRGLNDARSEEILLIHDHAQTTDMFPKIMDRLLEKGIQFQPIPLA